MRGKNYFILGFILLLAVVLRFYHLSELPPGFHVDEVIVGYNAYSLMKTARDENGNFLPLYINSFGDFRPAGYFYLTIPAIKIFGLNELAVRFPSAFFGSLTVLITYFLVKELFSNSQFARLPDGQAIRNSLIGSLLLAISPWHIIISRATSESSVALFLIVLGAYFFLLGVRRQKFYCFFLTSLLFFASFFFYHTPRLFVPLLAFGLVLFYWQKLRKKKVVGLGLLFFCWLSSFLVIFLFQGTSRFKQVSIFNNPGVQLRLDEQIREERQGENVLLVRTFHNKLVNYGLAILSNYGKYFSFDFLFIKGGLPVRYVVPDMGLLYLVELPFLILGLLFIFQEKKKTFWLPVFWMLTGPVAASLTFEDVPNIQRAFFILPSFQIITAYGFYKSSQTFMVKKQWKYLLVLFSSAGLIFNFGYFLHQYTVHQRVHRPWYRNYGFKELVKVLNEKRSAYQRVVLTKVHNDPYIYILFYNKYDPRRYQQYAHLQSEDRWGFENYIFSPQECPSYFQKDVFREGKTLFVDRGECKIKPYEKVLKTIYYEDHSPVFRLIEVNKESAIKYFKK